MEERNEKTHKESRVIMEPIIIGASVITLIGVSLMTVPVIAEKQEAKKERKRQSDVWSAHLEMLEVAKREREKNPDNYKPFQVDFGKDAVFLGRD